jgi:hypothetical protein
MVTPALTCNSMDESHLFRAAARDAALHIFGAVSAIIMLALALNVTTRMLPPRAASWIVAADLPHERKWYSAQRESTAEMREPPRPARLRRAHLRRGTPVLELAFAVPVKLFVPPSQMILSVPEYIDIASAPEIASIAGEAITPPLPEFWLPPRPRPGVVRAILAALSPFRRVARFVAEASQPAVMGD